MNIGVLRRSHAINGYRAIGGEGRISVKVSFEFRGGCFGEGVVAGV